MMTIFINTFYKNSAAIIPIVPAAKQLATEDFYRDVKKYFNIKGNIRFKDSKTTASISDDILPAYIEQYRSSAGWALEAVEDVPEPKVIETTNTNIPLLVNKEILTNLKDIDFKMLVANYNSKKTLQNYEQVKLAKIIIKTILEHDINIELVRTDFLFLSDVICQIFKGELRDVYYTKAANKQKPSGKLFDAYNNYRRLMSVCGLLKRRSYAAPEQKNDDFEVLDPSVFLDLEFVKSNTKPTAEFAEKWLSCLSVRQKLLRDLEDPVLDYLKMFPIFTLDVGNFLFDLSITDVKTLHPTFNGYECWDSLYEAVLTKASKIKDMMVQNWLQHIIFADENTKKAIAFMVLPYFFPSTIVKSRESKKSYKASKLEVQEKFVHYFDALQEEVFLQEISSDQPTVVFLGEIDSLSSYVTFLNRKYHFSNPAEAIQNCLALYMALNIRYPAESLVVWNYVQRYIFGISTPHDINNSSVRSVHHQLTTP